MQITSYHLMSMPSAQCHVEVFRTDGGSLREIRLVSYTTTILAVKQHGFDIDIEVEHPVNCSRTTTRHVNRFTTELTGMNLWHELKKEPKGGICTVYNAGPCLSDMALRYASHGKHLR